MSLLSVTLLLTRMATCPRPLEPPKIEWLSTSFSTPSLPAGSSSTRLAFAAISCEPTCTSLRPLKRISLLSVSLTSTVRCFTSSTKSL